MPNSRCSMSMAIRNNLLGSSPMGDPMLPRLTRVLAQRHEVGQTWTLELESDAQARTFVPGQFNMLYAFGVGEVAISMSGDPADADRLVHTIRAVGATSTALTRLQAGDHIGMRGPFGTGWPMQPALDRDVIVVAGGLGLAPLRPALYRILAERERYGKVILLYGARNPDDILFRQELETWRSRLDLTIEVTVDHATSAWHGHVGVVTSLIRRADFDPSRAIAFVCGPETMMRFTAKALKEAGLDDTTIYFAMERNMKCAVGFCGHCQFGPHFICKDGPVLRYDRLRDLLWLKEI
ncbi:Sulfhydrogenase subunit gamma [Methylovirgula sp. HY1]|nr:Sulfhydrogenase subunit gamma [Methylovirgula sp. HY1]